MARAARSIDVSEVPGLLAIVEEVRSSGNDCVLTHGGEPLAVIRPTKPRAAKSPRSSRPRKTGIVTMDDPIWNLVGMGSSTGPGDISENKHKYLAEAYADLHE